MDHLTFTIEDVAASRVLGATTVAPQEQLGETIGRILSQIHAAAGDAAGAPAVCVYPEPYDPQRVVAMPAVPFQGDPPYGFRIAELPACRAVVGHVTGGYEHLSEAWLSTMAHVQEQGLEPRGAPYERYLADGTTEIIVPLS